MMPHASKKTKNHRANAVAKICPLDMNLQAGGEGLITTLRRLLAKAIISSGEADAKLIVKELHSA
jgi:hypothetical protein